MAKLQTKSDNINPFGGLFPFFKTFDKFVVWKVGVMNSTVREDYLHASRITHCTAKKECRADFHIDNKSDFTKQGTVWVNGSKVPTNFIRCRVYYGSALNFYTRFSINIEILLYLHSITYKI